MIQYDFYVSVLSEIVYYDFVKKKLNTNILDSSYNPKLLFSCHQHPVFKFKSFIQWLLSWSRDNDFVSF